MFKIEGNSNCLVGSHFQSPPLFFRNRPPPWLRIFPVSSSTTHQFPGNLKDGAHMEWKEKYHKESTQRTKVALGLFLPCIKRKNCGTATCSPPSLYSKTLLPSEKLYRIQYITFCFTSLELQNERAGNRNKNLPSLHWIWFSVGPHRNQREQLNCIFFFCCGVCDSLTTTPLPPCLPNFHKSSLPPAVRVREADKGEVLFNRSSSPPLVCLWWRRLCQEQCLLLLCCPGCGLLR